MSSRRTIKIGARGWIGVDLDGTLAMHRAYCDSEPIGPPVPAMLDRVIAWLEQGIEVRILTARAMVGATTLPLPMSSAHL